MDREGIERVLESRKVKDGDCGCEEWACRGFRSPLVRAPRERKGRKEKKRKKERKRDLFPLVTYHILSVI